MGTELGHASVVEDRDPVGVADGEQVVRDDDRRALAHQLAQRLEQALAGLGVEAGRGLVEDQHRRVGEQRAGDRDPLALAAGEVAAALADVGVVAVRRAPR